MLLDTIRALFKSPSDSAPPGQQSTASGASQPPGHENTREETTQHDAPTTRPRPEPVALAACVLLLEIAHADGEFSAEERTHLEHVLDRHFGLPEATAHALLEEAERERRSSVDHFSFTQQIKRDYDLGQKMVLAEVMWGLVLADGWVNDHEHYLTRKISNLLDLEPAYLSAAKEKAARRSS